jgi:hypothetical protein
MKIYFEIPCGYRTPDISGEEVGIIPPKGSYMDVFTERYKCTVELRVIKICFNDTFTDVTVTLAEED